MAVCEKCWADAYLRSKDIGKSQYDCYLELLEERKDNPCDKKVTTEQTEKITH